MLSRDALIRMIRRSQTYISIFAFIAVFFICWKFTHLDITQIQLSNWGKSGWVAKLWNTAVCGFAISIFVNSTLYLRSENRLRYRNIFYILFGLLSGSLFMVGFFNIDHMLVHNISAGAYFFFYPLTIFMLAYFNRKRMAYSEWLYMMALSASMAAFPMLLMGAFKGKAMAEIAHTILAIIYNIMIARRN